ncbi:MAG TPA: hypothetical protein VFC60_00015 [Tissierellaceae bacterium]|nr:hypothetical protein [Tissierellaceae bacterium]
MKRSIILMFILISLMGLLGCANPDNTSIFSEYRSNKKVRLKYNVEQMSFSKSFQTTDAAVEIIENNEDNFKILAHLGLADYSTVKVDKILMKKNIIDIYVSGDKENKETSLSVPQMIINLNKNNLDKFEDIKFNVVYEDFTPIKIKFKINDVLNKLESHFKISSNSLPRFDLINLNDNILWEITYNSVFYKDMKDTPLIDLYALVDANSGDIIESDKNIISQMSDTGHILDYMQNESLLYKQKYNSKENDKLKEQLYSYSIVDKKNTLLYSSNYKISSGKISPDLENVSFLETSENGNEMYIVSSDTPKLYKIIFEETFTPYTIKWKDNNKLYILGKEDNKSAVYTYDLSTNELTLINKLREEIETFNIFNDYFLLVEKSDNEYNKRIFLTKDWKKLKPLNIGFNPQFIDDENIVYIKKDESSNIDFLSIYNLEENEVVRRIDRNVVSYSIFEDNIVYIKNNPSYNDYTMYNYSTKNKENTYISNIMCKNVYYNSHDNIIYLNTTLPFNNDDMEMIYSIDLNNIKNP